MNSKKLVADELRRDLALWVKQDGETYVRDEINALGVSFSMSYGLARGTYRHAIRPIYAEMISRLVKRKLIKKK